LCASFPIVVVLPVPLTPTTRITLGLPRGRASRLAEHLRDLLRERAVQVGQLVPRFESAHELGGGTHADIALDQRLLEPLPVLALPGSKVAARAPP
jgi:hypothetical protein